MDFKDQIKLLGDRVNKLKDQIATEEATKNAFIMPFLQALGYDVFNPMEVVPEYISDIGTKKYTDIHEVLNIDAINVFLSNYDAKIVYYKDIKMTINSVKYGYKNKFTNIFRVL